MRFMNAKVFAAPALALALASCAIAQGTGSSASSAAALAQLPGCGLQCLLDAVSSSTCSPTNQTCICTNEAVTTHVTACVMANCTVIDALRTKNISQTACGAPIRDQSASYAAASLGLAVLSNVVVLTRFVFKWAVKSQLWWDDLALAILIIAGIPSVIITAQGTVRYGLGRDVWTLTPSEITSFGYFFYFSEWLYFLQITLLKLTLLFFFLKIFPAADINRLLWATIGFTATWGTIFVLVAIFQCVPISFFWTNWDGLQVGRCLNINAIGWANAAISIVLDIWMLALPLWQIKGLNMSWKKKAGVILMFCVGTFVTVVSVLRLQALLSFANSTNPTWDNLPVSVWSTIEINIGIICTCMPTLRLILVRFLPSLGTTNNSKVSASSAGSRARRDKFKRLPDKVGAIPDPEEGMPRNVPKGPAPPYHAYGQRFSDETDIVEMHNLKYPGGRF